MDDIFGSHYMETVNVCVVAACFFFFLSHPSVQHTGQWIYRLLDMECGLTNCCGYSECPSEQKDDQFDLDF